MGVSITPLTSAMLGNNSNDNQYNHRNRITSMGFPSQRFYAHCSNCISMVFSTVVFANLESGNTVHIPELDLLLEDVLHPGLHEGCHGLCQGGDPSLLRQGLHPLQYLSYYTLSCSSSVITRAAGELYRYNKMKENTSINYIGSIHKVQQKKTQIVDMFLMFRI